MRRLFKDATYLTPDFRRGRGHIVVEDGVIAEVTHASEPPPLADEIIDARGLVVIPGLVNAHFHGQSLLLRGLDKDVAITDWFDESTRGRTFEKAGDFLDECAQEDFLTVAVHSYAELVREGVTCTQDSGTGEQSATFYGEALERVGLRGLIDSHGADVPEVASPRLRYSAHIPEEEDVKDEIDEACGRARRDQRVLTTHCLETAERRKIVEDAYGKSTVALFDELGVLRAPILLFHMVHATPGDLYLLAARGASVAHCPSSNLATGTGIAKVAEMLDLGIRVGIGTDWANTDIWAEMRLAYLLLKQGPNAARFTAETVWRMATLDGARALGFDDVGEIRSGRRADLTFLEIEDDLSFSVEREDLSTFAHSLLLTASRRHVVHVLVDGEWVLRDRALTRVDEIELRRRYRAVVKTAIPNHS